MENCRKENEKEEEMVCGKLKLPGCQARVTKYGFLYLKTPLMSLTMVFHRVYVSTLGSLLQVTKYVFLQFSPPLMNLTQGVHTLSRQFTTAYLCSDPNTNKWDRIF